ncbi:MAG: hypothetical protein EZS28_055081, partial [Streblomastix strix]
FLTNVQQLYGDEGISVGIHGDIARERERLRLLYKARNLAQKKKQKITTKGIGGLFDDENQEV